MVHEGVSIDPDAGPSVSISLQLNTLTSGNVLYDAELMRRIDFQRHPRTLIELRSAARITATNFYQVTGDLTLHGVTRLISGTVALSLSGDCLRVTGEHYVDVRDFGITPPNVLMLQIYPDVKVQLELEAQSVAGPR